MHFDIMGGLSAFGGGLVGLSRPVPVRFDVVVFFHELGHFLVARWCGVQVLVFSIGFGPEIVGFNDRHGTRWKISAIPLGGYVKFFGDENAASVPDQAAAASMTEEERRTASSIRPVGRARGDRGGRADRQFHPGHRDLRRHFHDRTASRPRSARVDAVQPNSAAAAAGFKPGDVVLVDRRQQDRELLRHAAHRQRQRRPAADDRGRARRRAGDAQGHARTAARSRTTSATCTASACSASAARMAPGDIKTEQVGPLQARRAGRPGNLVRHRPDAVLYRRGVRRPRSGRPARRPDPDRPDFRPGRHRRLCRAVHLAAVLSVSIGLLNLFPVPLLDGGHLLFYGIEAVRGRPLSERAQEIGFRIGLAIVVMLMIFATFNDILAPGHVSMTVAVGQLSEGKGKLGAAKFVCSADETL